MALVRGDNEDGRAVGPVKSEDGPEYNHSGMHARELVTASFCSTLESPETGNLCLSRSDSPSTSTSLHLCGGPFHSAILRWIIGPDQITTQPKS